MHKTLTSNETSFDKLKSLRGQDVMIQVYRDRIDDSHLDGFVIGLSSQLLLVQVIDGLSLALNGYSVVRLRDITSWSIDESFITRALRLLRRHPVLIDGLQLTGWYSLLTWLQKRELLVMVEQEKVAPGCAFIGQIIHLSKQTLSLREVDDQPLWHKEITDIGLKNITQVEFEDGYTLGIAALLVHENIVISDAGNAS